MMNKKKILHVYKSFYPETIGGVEKFIEQISDSLSATNDFGLFCLGNNTKVFKYKKIKVFRYKKDFEISSCPFSIKAFFDFKKIASYYDIIHFHYPFPFMDLLSLNVSKKSIVTYHSDIVKQKILKFFYFFLQQFFLSRQHFIIATSRNYLKTSNVLKKFYNKVKVIPFGIKNKKIKSKYKKKEAYILFVGTIRYYKGLDILLLAAKDIETKIFICGSGKELYFLKELKKKMNLKNVFFLGRVSEKKKNFLLKNCELFVFPSNSRSEAFGLAMLEAMSYGKPLISCKIGSGTSFLNINNKTGYVIKPNDPKALAKKINFLLNKRNIKIKNKFSKNSEERFNKFFRLKFMSDSYNKIYRNLIN